MGFPFVTEGIETLDVGSSGLGSVDVITTSREACPAMERGG